MVEFLQFEVGSRTKGNMSGNIKKKKKKSNLIKSTELHRNMKEENGLFQCNSYMIYSDTKIAHR